VLSRGLEGFSFRRRVRARLYLIGGDRTEKVRRTQRLTDHD
jgi:hypothetical protein